MEASAAGLAGGTASGDGQAADGQQGSDGAPAQGEQAQGQQGDAAIAQMAETLQGLSSSHEEMRQILEAQGQQQGTQQQQQEQQPPAADLSFLDEASPNYDPQRAAERLTEVMREQAGVATQAELAKVLAPLQQQVSDMQRAHEADALVAEFPDLGKEEIAGPVVKAAEQYAHMVGTPELASNTAFIRMTYLAGQAAQLAQQQQQGAAGAPGAATLEGAGGASPGGAGQGASQTADSIRESWSQGSDVLARL
jgi:hypothetical protein